MNHQEEPITVEEVKKEFQLERMILFSDAVFAIVITLMAIEIRLPETDRKISYDDFLHHLKPLISVIIAYMASFVFIGSVWFQHLRIFSLLKEYDKGLVIRNLLLLFFIGLFPFAASVVTKSIEGSQLPIIIYFLTILLCLTAQFILHHYILIKKPELRNDLPAEKFIEDWHKQKTSLIIFTCIIILIIITGMLITNPYLKGLSMLWFMLFPLALKFTTKKKK